MRILLFNERSRLRHVHAEAKEGRDAFTANNSSLLTLCEYSLLMYYMCGDAQPSTLADAIRAALMLRYNDRVVG